MRNYDRFQVKIDFSRAIYTYYKSSMGNDMFDFNVLKFFDINIRIGKVIHPLPIRFMFLSPGWVKINIDGAARGSPDLAACGDIFHGIFGEFISGFSAFLDIQTVLIF